MKRPIYIYPLLVFLIASLACNLPSIPASESPPATAPVGDADPEPTQVLAYTETPLTPLTEEPYACAPQFIQATALTVQFCYPASLANGYTHAIIPEKHASYDEMPWSFNPDMLEIHLTDYPVANMYQQPRIFIYPVDGYSAFGPSIQITISELQTLLSAQDPAPDFIPFLPIEDAAQLIQANVSYLTFRNGSGVRFITQYSQGAVPISNDNAVYAFMGMTDDGAYIIAATFPVTHPFFYPDMMTEPEEGWMTFGQNLETYLNDMEIDLAGQTPDSFTPNLTFLDEMMRSFLVPPDAVP